MEGNDSALVRCPVSSVIASGAKQSPRVFKGQPGDCFVAALRNDRESDIASEATAKRARTGL